MKSELEVHSEFWKLYREVGTLRGLTVKLGFSKTYLHDVLQKRKPISGELAARLGYEMRIKRTVERTYESIISGE